jgi:ADP-sugar diphosphatase
MQYFLMFSCRLQGVDMFGERVGFLKFKAEIFYKETGKKVSNYIHALLLNLN